MSVIQKIRDKYARWAVIAIALSLVGFILMDAFAGRGSIFSGQNTTVGKINGKKIDYQDFAKKVDATEKFQKEQGYDQGEAGRQQVIQSIWDQEVNDVVLARQYDELGLAVSDKELRDILYGANPPQDLRQRFTDPNTGVYNGVQAQQFISQIRKQGTQQDKDQLNQYLVSLEKDRLQTKYTSLLANSVYFPKWFIEKRNVDNSLMAKVSYVSIPYSSISDSAVKVSDDEIKAYINEHKKQFEQEDETRSISYVTFSAAPNASDSAATRNALMELKPRFDTVTNYETFIARNSAMPFYGGFITKSAIQQPNKDSILSAPVGVVYGPYLDAGQNGTYVLSKIIASATIPDTVKVRHVLVATHQQTQTGELMPVRDDSAAKHLVDSIQMLHRAGTSFDTLVAKFSDDPGSKSTGGVYDNVTTGRMVPSFNDFIFTHKTGETGVVKTDFGYHYIEILSQKGSSPAYKIAYLAKPIVASQETENTAQNAATVFAGDSRNEKSFNENWEKNLRAKGINKLSATDIRPLDFSIQGINGTSRKFIKDVFEADKGDVIGPELVGDAYVVAVVTEVNEEGLAGVARVRPIVEPILRNRKKAEQIKKNIGAVTTLEAVASKVSQQVQTVDSVRFSGANNMLGYEPKVLGASFNPANKGKVVNEPIPGQAGVYVLRVDNTSTVPVESASIEEQRKAMVTQAQQRMMQMMQYGGGNPFIEPLKKAADIKDNRAKFF
ncbi:MAG TPA: peptidylprolyl isomerase [Flavisolibacter sp.]|nr:peptidylprolyl isomerase [Flavisolibacter sp.]